VQQKRGESGPNRKSKRIAIFFIESPFLEIKMVYSSWGTLLQLLQPSKY
jgi:hypothetical protein